MTPGVPLGLKALHPDWPEARFNVSGMFIFTRMVLDYIDLMRRGFDTTVGVEAMHGAPAVRWNAGRFSKFAIDPGQLPALLNAMHARGIGYFPTFTNHLLDEKDLDDPVCNQILQCVSRHTDLNGVIVVSDLLSRRISQLYPQLRQVASIIKVTFDGGKGKPDYYRRLGDRFHRYVVHPDDCRDMRLMEQLDRDKAEIIVNENCVADCPAREHHYELYARIQLATTPEEMFRVQGEIDAVVQACQSPIHADKLGSRRRNCNLTHTEMKGLYDMGFRHFKLQGRADDPYMYCFDLTRFTLEPDMAAPLAYKAVCKGLRRRND